MNIDGTLLLLGQTVLFFFPAYIANLCPIAFSKLKIFGRFFAKPLDAGKMLGGKRLFGKNKTLGGFVFGSLGGVIGAVMVVIFIFITKWHSLGLLDTSTILLYLCFGFLLGFGAMTGDLVESFLKRRIGIAEGKPWWFFDQADFVVGAWLFSGLLIPYANTWPLFLVGMLITPPLHLLANFLAFKAKLKKVWW